MNKQYTYEIQERSNTFRLNIIINEGNLGHIKFLGTYTENQYKTIKKILFLKGIKINKDKDSKIDQETYNLLSKYV